MAELVLACPARAGAPAAAARDRACMLLLFRRGLAQRVERGRARLRRRGVSLCPR